MKEVELWKRRKDMQKVTFTKIPVGKKHGVGFGMFFLDFHVKTIWKNQ